MKSVEQKFWEADFMKRPGLPHVSLILFLLWPLLLLSQPQERVTLTILHTNDEHSHLIPHPVSEYHSELEHSAMGGFARLAGKINQIRNEKAESGEPVLLFSGGDIIGGPAFGWLILHGLSPELNLMQRIGYDAVVIGNHEFDYGPERLSDYLRNAGYPEDSNRTAVLGTNITPPEGHPLNDRGIQKSILRELDNGLKVGIFGLIGDDAVSKTVRPGDVEFQDPIESARMITGKLKEQGADLIISVNHSGVEEDRNLAESVPDIDVIVGGHSHTALYEPIRVGNTVIVQAGSYLRYLGKLELVWDPETERVSVLNRENGTPFLIPMDHTITPDPEVTERIEFYETTLNRWVYELTGGDVESIRQPVAASDVTLWSGPPGRETNLGNFITDAIRVEAANVSGRRVDVAVQANGAIRSSVEPGSMEWSKGEISFYDLVMSSGLGSGDDGNPGFPIVTFYLTEEEVWRAMEISHLLNALRGNTYFLQFSGVRMEFDPGRAVLMNIPFSGRPVPTTRAVRNAELFEGEGIQEEGDEWRVMNRNSQQLLHVATDYYIASFLPLVGELLPSLTIELKDKDGVPIDLEDSILYRNDSQLKVWQAVTAYAASFSPVEQLLSEIPEVYHTSGSRLVEQNMIPLWFWPGLLLLAAFGFTVYFIRRKSRTKSQG